VTQTLQEVIDGLDLTGVEYPCWYSAAMSMSQEQGPTKVARLLCAMHVAGLAASDDESDEDMDRHVKNMFAVINHLDGTQLKYVLCAVIDGWCGLLEVAKHLDEMTGIPLHVAAQECGYNVAEHLDGTADDTQ